MSESFGPLRTEFGELRGRTLWVVLGCLICQMGLGLTYVSRPLAPFVIDELGLSRTAFSSASVSQLLAQSLVSPAVGYLAVRLGASRVLAFGAALFTLTFLLFARIESLMGLYIAIAGVGFGAACMGDVAVGHVVSRWTSRSRGLALGIMVMSGSSERVTFSGGSVPSPIAWSSPLNCWLRSVPASSSLCAGGASPRPASIPES